MVVAGGGEDENDELDVYRRRGWLIVPLHGSGGIAETIGRGGDSATICRPFDAENWDPSELASFLHCCLTLSLDLL